MTKDREQQMLKASQLYPRHQQKVFVDGALWADKHPSPEWIDKAFDFLIERYENQGVVLLDDINEFKEFMEEQQ